MQVDGGGPGMLLEEFAQPLDPRVVQGVDRKDDLQRVCPVDDELGPLQFRADQFGDLVAQVEPATGQHPLPGARRRGLLASGVRRSGHACFIARHAPGAKGGAKTDRLTNIGARRRVGGPEQD